jgi:hypothetical protein
MLGERQETAENLEEDIRVMKDLFHTQLSDLVDELAALKAAHPAPPPSLAQGGRSPEPVLGRMGRS